MGGVQGGHNAKSVDQEAEEFVNFLQARNNSSGKPLRPKSTPKSPLGTEMAWRQQLIDILQEHRMKNKWKEAAEGLLLNVKCIQLDSFVRAVSVLFQLSNKEVKNLHSKHVMKDEASVMKHVPEVKQSKNVFVSFAGQLLHFSMMLANPHEQQRKALGGAITDLFKKEPSEHSTASLQQSPNKERRDKQRSLQKRKRQMAMWILCEQFNQPYHPYSSIKEYYCKFLQAKYKKLLDQSIQPKPSWQKLCRMMQHDLKFVCSLFTDASSLYHTWIMEYAEIKEDKIPNLIGKAVLNSLFSGANNLHPMIVSAIDSVNRQKAIRVALTIRDNVNVERFLINRKLQIDGNYVQSLMMLAEMDRVNNPRGLLRFLERLRDQICNDIDFFHRLYETGQQFTVDGDNLLGILCFLVCRLKAKLPQLQSQIMFLRVAFGDEVTMLYEAASYMVTAFMAVFEFIESEEFRKIMEAN